MNSIETIKPNIENLSYRDLKEALETIDVNDIKEINRLKDVAKNRSEYLKAMETKENKTDNDRCLIKVARTEYYKISIILNRYNYLRPYVFNQADWLVYYSYISMPKNKFDTLVKKANEMLTNYLASNNNIVHKENRELKLRIADCITSAKKDKINEEICEYNKQINDLRLDKLIFEEENCNGELSKLEETKKIVEKINELEAKRAILQKDRDESIMCQTSHWFEKVIYEYCPQDEARELFSGAKRYYYHSFKSKTNISSSKKREILHMSFNKNDEVKIPSNQVNEIKKIVEEKVDKALEEKKESENSLSKLTDDLIKMSEDYKELVNKKSQLEKEICKKVDLIYNGLENKQGCRSDLYDTGLTKASFLEFIEDIFEISSTNLRKKLKEYK